jgi:hypothetical protein
VDFTDRGALSWLFGEVVVGLLKHFLQHVLSFAVLVLTPF